MERKKKKVMLRVKESMKKKTSNKFLGFIVANISRAYRF